MSKLSSLEDLYLEKIRSLCASERRISAIYPDLAGACFSPVLEGQIQQRAQVASQRVQVLEALGMQEAVDCTVESLLNEATRLVTEDPQADPAVLDAGVSSVMQVVAQCMIAGYSCGRSYGSLLQLREAYTLHQYCNEEMRWEADLNRLIQEVLNPEAAETRQPPKAKASFRFVGKPSGDSTFRSASN